MDLTKLRQIGHSCCKNVLKICDTAQRSRSPLPGRRVQRWRKHRNAQIKAEQALPNSDDAAFVDFDGTQVAAGIPIHLKQQSETLVRDPAQVVSMQAWIGGLPSSIPPMPDRLPGEYELVKTLNGDLGHFNNPIHLVRHITTEKQFIIKQVPVADKQDSPNPLEGLTEATILEHLDHENIIKIEKVHLNHDGPFCIANIVLQYCDGGDVCDFVASLRASRQRMPVQFVQHFVSSMLDAMLLMHHCETYDSATDEIQHHRDLPVFHRDIKEKNIFLDKSNPASNGLPRVLLADFGLASTEEMNKGVGGTRGYLAPELICGPLETSSQSPTASLVEDDQVLQGTGGDWYAFGVTLYQVITGKSYLFQPADKTRADLAASSSCNEQEILELVLNCLKTDPVDRPQVTDSLRLHHLSAKLKAGLHVWHDEGGRLPEEIWPEAFLFERVERSAKQQCSSGAAAHAAEIARIQAALLELPILPQASYHGAMQIQGSSSHAWLRPKVGLRRR